MPSPGGDDKPIASAGASSGSGHQDTQRSGAKGPGAANEPPRTQPDAMRELAEAIRHLAEASKPPPPDVLSRIWTKFYQITPLLLLVLVGVQIHEDWRHPRVVIDAIAVPKDFDKRGLTSEVIARRLADELTRIRQRAESNATAAETSARKQHLEMPNRAAHVALANRTERIAMAGSDDSPDIKIPEAGLSFRAVLDFIEKYLGIEARHVSGEITIENDPPVAAAGTSAVATHPPSQTSYLLIVIRDSDADKPITEKAGAEELDDGLRKSAADVLPLIDPYIAAVDAFYRKDFEAAISDFTKAIKVKPGADAYNNRGVAYARTGRNDSAIADYSSAIGRNRQYSDAYYNRGIAYEKSGNYLEAISNYDSAIRYDPDLGGAYVNRAVAYDDLGKFDKAIADCDVAIHLDQQDIEALNNRAISFIHVGRSEEAIRDCDRASQLDPNSSTAYINRGAAYANLENYPRAIADCDSAIRLDRNSPLPYYNRGVVYQRQGNFDEAIASYDQALRLNSKDPDSFYNRGTAYLDKGNYDQAIADLSQAIDLQPKYLDAYGNRGVAYLQKGNYRQAFADYNREIQLGPGNANAYFNRCWAFAQIHAYPSALADCDKAISLDPNQANAYATSGTIFSDQGNFAQAIDAYDKAVRLNPKDAGSYNLLAWILATCPDAKYRNGQQAVAYAKKAVELASNGKAEIVDTLAAAYAESGDFKQAVATEREALQYQTKNAKEFRARLALYEHGKPYRSPPVDREAANHSNS